jgi:hypothetical protein
MDSADWGTRTKEQLEEVPVGQHRQFPQSPHNTLRQRLARPPRQSLAHKSVITVYRVFAIVTLYAVLAGVLQPMPL